MTISKAPKYRMKKIAQHKNMLPLFQNDCSCKTFQNEFDFHGNEPVGGDSFSFEWFCAKPRFDAEAKGSSEIAYCRFCFCTLLFFSFHILTRLLMSVPFIVRLSHRGLLTPVEKRTQCFRFQHKGHQNCTFGRVLISLCFFFVCPTFQEMVWKVA